MSEIKKGSASTAMDRLKHLKENSTPEELLELDKGLQQIKPVEPPVATTVEETLAQRGSRYGDFTDHARVCQRIKEVMMGEPGWHKLTDVQKQAMEVMADKFARILVGDPNYDDNWHDIQGYAKLAEDRLPCNQKKES